jgi:hypothetical protein
MSELLELDYFTNILQAALRYPTLFLGDIPPDVL